MIRYLRNRGPNGVPSSGRKTLTDKYIQDSTPASMTTLGVLRSILQLIPGVLNIVSHYKLCRQIWQDRNTCWRTEASLANWFSWYISRLHFPPSHNPDDIYTFSVSVPGGSFSESISLNCERVPRWIICQRRVDVYNWKGHRLFACCPFATLLAERKVSPPTPERLSFFTWKLRRHHPGAFNWIAAVGQTYSPFAIEH